MSCALVLPSGRVYVYGFQVKTIGGFEVTLVWYNTATEVGWYDFHVKAAANGVGGYDMITFDPPGKGGEEPPIIHIAVIEQF